MAVHKLGFLAAAIAAGLLLTAGPSDAARRRAHAPVMLVPGDVAGDFDNDGNPDILWANAERTRLRVWTMTGLKPASVVTLPMAYGDPAMVPAGTADFDGDQNTDVLFWNAGTGVLTLWHLAGFDFAYKTEIDARVSGTPVSVFDFDRDGAPDILFQDHGLVYVAIVVGEQIVDKVAIDLPAADRARIYAVVGAADFDRDGDFDLVLYHTPADPEIGLPVPAQLAVALLQGNVGTIQEIAPNADLNQSVRAVADYDLDGDPDLIWENTFTGEMTVWDLSGVVVLNTFTYPTGLRPPWFMVGPR